MARAAARFSSFGGSRYLVITLSVPTARAVSLRRGADTIELDILLQDVAGGDREAFERLYDRTVRYVFGVLMRILDDRETATEVAQQVYAQVWENAERFDPARGSALTWLSTIARSRALDRARSSESYERALEGVEAAPDAHPTGSRPENPAEAAEVRRRREAVREAMDELPDEQRAVLRLSYFGGLSQREIANETGIPLGTVKSRMRSAMGKLEDRLRPALEGTG